MNVKFKYWYFEEGVPENVCDNIVKFALAHKLEDALTQGDVNELKKKGKLSEEHTAKRKKEIRDSSAVFLSEPWIYKEITPYIRMANTRAGWNFQWHWTEPVQFTEYKLNQFYHFHQDGEPEPYDKPNEPQSHGSIRKLSSVVNLCHPEEYEGGKLEFDFKAFYGPEHKGDSIWPCKEVAKKGSIVVFPSFVWHRVQPITAGKRYSLVSWSLGKPFQ